MYQCLFKTLDETDIIKTNFYVIVYFVFHQNSQNSSIYYYWFESCWRERERERESTLVEGSCEKFPAFVKYTTVNFESSD